MSECPLVHLDIVWNPTGAQTSQVTKIGTNVFSTVTATYRADGEAATTSTVHGSHTSSTTRTYEPGGSRPTAMSSTIPGPRTLGSTWACTDTGHLDVLTIGGVTVEDRTYRPDGSVLTVATPVGSHQHSYDGHGRQLSHNATGLGGPNQTYGYDTAGRVVGDGQSTFGYDANNNRTLADTPEFRMESWYRQDNSISNDRTTYKPNSTPVVTGNYPIDPAGRRTHPFPTDRAQTPPPTLPAPDLDN